MNLRRGVNSLLQRAGLSLHFWPPPNSVQRELKALLSERRVDCVFDIGANRGQYALNLREVGFNGTILSFEPNMVLAPVLHAASANDPHWHVLPYALGEDEGTLTLHITEGDDLASALSVSDYARATFAGVTDVRADEAVPVHRLDGVYADLAARHDFSRPFLKIDTQGYDLHVLRGAVGVLNHMVGLQTEVSFKPLYDEMPDVTESLAAIRAAGFEVAGMYPVVRDGSGAMIEMDCVAVRRA